MRLIDADELLDSLKEWDDSTGTANSMKAFIHATIWTVMDMVDDQPTAYDVDKVVEELEKGIELIVGSQSFKGIYIKKSQAIDIVKRGGMNE